MSSTVDRQILNSLAYPQTFSAALSTASQAEVTFKAGVAGQRLYITALTITINNTHASAVATITFRNGLGGGTVAVAQVRAGQLLSLPIHYGGDAPLTLDSDNALTFQVSGVGTSHSTCVSAVGYQL